MDGTKGRRGTIRVSEEMSGCPLDLMRPTPLVASGGSLVTEGDSGKRKPDQIVGEGDWKEDGLVLWAGLG
ncbi:hypothetical protein BM221_008884 [Beauveria bassiana]|uniref:Uncharacterized protein n=1 Tax=Beauveria bassiana TaxID=176275 RepID=A0A2N6NE65_BEABA|nr:hypothetical protein BM221_008884 [Beauveria bassiana]